MIASEKTPRDSGSRSPLRRIGSGRTPAARRLVHGLVEETGLVVAGAGRRIPGGVVGHARGGTGPNPRGIETDSSTGRAGRRRRRETDDSSGSGCAARLGSKSSGDGSAASDSGSSGPEAATGAGGAAFSAAAEDVFELVAAQGEARLDLPQRLREILGAGEARVRVLGEEAEDQRAEILGHLPLRIALGEVQGGRNR